MKPSDPGITWIDDKPLGLAERLYVPLFVQGLARFRVTWPGESAVSHDS